MFFSSNHGKALPLSLKAASFFLLAGLLVYPFTVAGSNFFFALLFLCILLNLNVLKQGFCILWNQYRPISIAIGSFSLCVLIGFTWSENTQYAQQMLGKQIYWLLLPCIIGILSLQPSLKGKVYIALSLGLLAHLILSTLQYLSLVVIDSGGIGGSHAADPTGYLGHLSFGFIYAIWAGSLIIFAQRVQMQYKILLYLLALYAFFMVFLAQGRGGYLISLGIIVLLVWKVFFPNKNYMKLLVLLGFSIVITIFVFNNAPVKNKIHKTIITVQSFINGDWKNTNQRIKIWGATIEIWKQHPYFGIGTGDYRPAYIALVNDKNYAYLNNQGTHYNTAHNEYLFNLVRWGPIGLIITVFMFWALLRTGLAKDWQSDTLNAYLLTATALALIINSFSDVTLSGYNTLIFAILVLSLSMVEDVKNQ